MYKSSAATFLAAALSGSVLVSAPAKAQNLSDGNFEGAFVGELETSTTITFAQSKISIGDIYYKDGRPDLFGIEIVLSGTLDNAETANACLVNGDKYDGVKVHINMENAPSVEVDITGIANKDHLLRLRESIKNDHKTHKISEETKFWIIQILHESNYCKPPETYDKQSQYLELPSVYNARPYNIKLD